jgi:hypothetical protein
MQRLQQVNIVMPNVPSSLAKVGDKLRAADINIDAITCTESSQHTAIHLIVDDPDTAKIVLKELGTVSMSAVIGLKVRNRPGVIADIGRACAAMGLNIHMIYSTTCGKEAMAYLSLDDVTAAIEALKKWEKSAGKLS